MKRFLLGIVLTLCVCSSLFAAYPYDSVAQLRVRGSGGSGSLIAVSETRALVLTCGHLADTVGGTVHIKWPSGAKSKGTVLEVGAYGFDIALVACPRPKGLRPIPIAVPNWNSTGRITNIGYPGNTGTPEWQTGKLTGIGSSSIRYTCRPIPGMSGGATLDQYGNLIGVITRYGPRRGESTSGVDMVNFISRYMRKQKPKTWSKPAMCFLDPVVVGETAAKILAPEEWFSYLLYIGIVYDIHPEENKQDDESVMEPVFVPDLKPATTIEVHKKKPTKVRHGSRHRRRLFRRRR